MITPTQIKSCFFTVALILLLSSPKTNGQGLSLLIEQLDAIRSEQKIAAYAIVITTPDTILIAENRGHPSLDSQDAVSPDAYFRVGSITKSFIGLAALIAEQDDLLTLNKPVQNYIGSDYFTNPWKNTTPVTIEQLLQHSAGLPDMSSSQEFNHNSEISNRQGLSLYAKDREVRWQPGLYYSYSNTGFGLAGLAIENASDLDINDYLSKHLFVPLDMPSATLQYTEKVQEKLVPGFDRDGRTQLPYWHLIFPAFGALNVQPKDMAHFVQLYLNRGLFQNHRLISEANMARAEKPSSTIAAREGLQYGYGLGLYNWYRNGHEFFGHGGDGDGYLARFGYSHDAQLGYFIVINRFQHQPLKDMQRAVEQWIVSDLDSVDFPPVFAIKNTEALVGSYQSVISRFSRGRTKTLNIFQQGNKLYSRLGDDQSYELIPVAENQFRRRNEPAATIVIKKVDDGVVFIGDEGNFLKQ